MNSTLIECLGINYLEHFLLGTRVIFPNIKRLDKYPIWDGELLVYNDSEWNKDNLFVRVPIQVKSELLIKEKREKERYSVNIADLEKYSDEGGVLFVKVIVDLDKDCGYFYFLLLTKGDIVDLINKSDENQQKKNIYLDEIFCHQEVITICKNYKLHRMLQMQIPQKINLNEISENTELYSYGYINKINDLVTKEQYVYKKTSDNMYAYVGKIKHDFVVGTEKLCIATRKKNYYKTIEKIYTERNMIMKINNYVSIKQKKISIVNKIDEDLFLDKTICDLEFVLDLYENRNIKIGDSDFIDFSFETEPEKIKERVQVLRNNLLYLYSAKKTLKLFNIPVNEVSIKQVIAEENHICKLRDILYKDLLINIPDMPSDTFVNVYDVMGFNVLIYFVRQENGKYKGYDFLNDDEVLKKLSADKNTYNAICRYFNLTCDILTKIIFDEKRLFLEVKKCCKSDIAISLTNNLMLEFIKSFDLTQNIRFLFIAERLNKILRDSKNGYTEELFKINKFQILKRKRLLSENEKKSIINIKICKDELMHKCSCCLLLDNYDEFEVLFNKMDNDMKAQFKSWPIYLLYKKVDNQKVINVCS